MLVLRGARRGLRTGAGRRWLGSAASKEPLADARRLPEVKVRGVDEMHKEPVVMEEMTPLVSELRTRIYMRGPIPVAEFMNTVLGHPLHGYYMRRDVFGPSGDFTTSPEISQLFGEMVAIWAIATWQKLGSPEAFRLVELGPGRGTLMSDFLRASGSFPAFCQALHRGGGICMVENSYGLREVQQKTLRCVSTDAKAARSEKHVPNGLDSLGEGGDQRKRFLHMDEEWERARQMGKLRMSVPVKTTSTRDSQESTIPIEWFKSFRDIPDEVPLLIVAQEMFDALPVHQFEYSKDNTWCERLVDVVADESVMDEETKRAGVEAMQKADQARQELGIKKYAQVQPGNDEESQDVTLGDKPAYFRFVLSASETPASSVFFKTDVLAPETSETPSPGDSVEICAAGAALAQDIAKRIAKTGGASLIIDYGSDGASSNSLRGIKKHEFVHPLKEPGNVDLSADVDFRYLRQSVEQMNRYFRDEDRNQKYSNVTIVGPVTQGDFLRRLGIETRVAMLLKENDGNSELQQQLFTSFQRLVDPTVERDEEKLCDGMGVAYKALSLVAPINKLETVDEQVPGFY